MYDKIVCCQKRFRLNLRFLSVFGLHCIYSPCHMLRQRTKLLEICRKDNHRLSSSQQITKHNDCLEHAENNHDHSTIRTNCGPSHAICIELVSRTLVRLRLFVFSGFFFWGGGRPTREFFTHMITSTLPVTGCRF